MQFMNVCKDHAQFIFLVFMDVPLHLFDPVEGTWPSLYWVGKRYSGMVINDFCITHLASLLTVVIVCINFQILIFSCLFLKIFWFADEQYGDSFSVDLSLFFSWRSRGWEKYPCYGSYIHTEGLEGVPAAGIIIVNRRWFLVSSHYYVFGIMDWNNTYRF